MLESTPQTIPAGTATASRGRGWRSRLGQLPLNLNLVIGGIGLLVLVLLSLLGPALFHLDAYTHDLARILMPPSLQGPGLQGLMGTDALGRDVFSRLVVGSRNSLAISFAAVVLTAIVGMVLGLLSGYYEGVSDAVIMRLADIQLAMPFILLTIVILTILPPTVPNIVLALAVTRWVVYARQSRALVLTLKREDYIQGARALGATDARILLRYILPNIAGQMLVLGGLQLATMVIMESTLSYLGLGVQAPEPSWGNIMREGQPYLNTAWWVATFAGLFLVLFVLSINLFGEGLRAATMKRAKL